MKKQLFVIILLSFSTQFYAQKSVKILLNDGTYRSYPVSEITKLTFVDDACDGVTKVSYEGRTYGTVQIGDQCWFTKNLNVGVMKESSAINDNQTDNSILEKYCYNNDTNYCNILGGLYQWNEAMQYSNTEGSQGICPSGWHIPTDTEYSALKTAVQNDGGTNGGNAIKTLGQGGFGSTEGNNASGFSALLVGSRSESSGGFRFLDQYTAIWSSTDVSNTSANSIYLYDHLSTISLLSDNKNHGFAIRCLKD